MEEKKLTDEKAMFNYIANDVLGQVKPLYLRQRIVVEILDLIHRLQAENERLTEELEKEYELRKEYMFACEKKDLEIKQLEFENAELQKQVDELKEKFSGGVMWTKEQWSKYLTEYSNDIKQSFKNGYDKAVKDTAKEIYENVHKWCDGRIPEGLLNYIKLFDVWLKERYGVEVEQ